MVLVTGAAGFIGYHACRMLLERGERVVGVDNFTPYYDPAMKRARVELLQKFEKFELAELNLGDRDAVADLFVSKRPSRVLHLAAQPGVRYSLVNPHAYIESNVDGFINILEGCRHNAVQHLVFASSSSVYGANTRQPYSEHDNVDHPLSLYAATKKSNELMAHTYAHLFRFPVTGLRFFTVYGPWGRPDMAVFKFTKDIIEGKPIPVYNNGLMIRDFTYVDDIIEGVIRVLDRPAEADPEWRGDAPDPATSFAPYRIYNIGNSDPVPLLDCIAMLEEAIGKKANIDFQPLQPGDVLSTMADVSELERAVDFRPRTSLREGISRFVAWYKEYYEVDG